MNYKEIPTQSPNSPSASKSAFNYGLPSQVSNNDNKQTNHPEFKQPFIFSHSDFFGNPKRIFIVFECIMLFLCLIQLFLSSIINDNAYIIKRSVMGIIMTLMCIEIILISSLWICSKSQNHEQLIISNKNDNNNKEKENNIYHNKSFRDDFNFRLEALCMVIVYGIGILVNTVNAGRARIASPDSQEWKELTRNSAFIVLFGQTLGILIQTIIPYYTLRKNLKKFNKETECDNIYVVSLLDVLSHKYGFFLFIDQLVQELSFENLSFLIEVYQFKFINSQNALIKEYGKKTKLRSYFRKRKLKKSTEQQQKQQKQIKNNEGNKIDIEMKLQSIPTTSREEISINLDKMVKLELDVSAPSNSNTNTMTITNTNNTIEPSRSYTEEDSQGYDSILDEYWTKKNGSDCKYYSNVLSKMPWNSLPLTASITSTKNNDKLKQAQNIFNKYIDRNSYDSVNCSYDAMVIIQEKMRKLSLWKYINDNNDTLPEISTVNSKSNTDVSVTVPVSNDNVNNLTFGLDLNEMNDIKNKNEWNELLLCIFDSALPDIFSNLEDSMTRFRYTKEFMSLIGSK